MKAHFLSVALLLVLWACNSDVENRELAQQLNGSWINTSLSIEMNTYRNGTALKKFSVKEGEWEKQMGVKPVLTIYHQNGTFATEHRNLRDSVFLRQAGKWTILGDSLFMRDTLPEESGWYRYRILFTGNRFKITGLEDSDNDGKNDDRYEGEMVKVK